MARAASLPAPIARITVAAPVTASPPANTPGRLVAPDASMTKPPNDCVSKPSVVALISGFVSFLIQGFFDNTFYNYRMYMLFFALLSLAASLFAVGGEEA